MSNLASRWSVNHADRFAVQLGVDRFRCFSVECHPSQVGSQVPGIGDYSLHREEISGLMRDIHLFQLHSREGCREAKGKLRVCMCH
jgi:hypothetical protein